jgi:hypothetical protein
LRKKQRDVLDMKAPSLRHEVDGYLAGDEVFCGAHEVNTASSKQQGGRMGKRSRRCGRSPRSRRRGRGGRRRRGAAGIVEIRRRPDEGNGDLGVDWGRPEAIPRAGGGRGTWRSSWTCWCDEGRPGAAARRRGGHGVLGVDKEQGRWMAAQGRGGRGLGFVRGAAPRRFCSGAGQVAVTGRTEALR